VRVRVVFTVEVDVDGWGRDYGVTGATAIRDDVRAYLSSVVRECNDNVKVVG